jgi:hypothetical protein
LNEKTVIIVGIDGEITIEGTKGGCAFELDGTSVTNNGNIFVRNGDGDAIELNSDGDIPGRFVNSSTGRIVIDNLLTGGDEAIDLGSSSIPDTNIFINNGYILISNIRLSDAIQIGINSLFINNCGIDITNVDDNAIDLSGTNATFINHNLLNVGRNPSSTTSDTSAIRINNNSQFINEACGIVNITTPHNVLLTGSEDSLTNLGLMTSVYTLDNVNEGIVVNKGEMRAPNNFASSPNAIMNMDGGYTASAGDIPSEESLYPAMCVVCTQFVEASIPTLGQWGIIILSMLLSIFGLVGIRGYSKQYS